MVEGIVIFENNVVCPMCQSDNIRIMSSETTHYPPVGDIQVFGILVISYECLSDCGHKFNIEVSFKRGKITATINECL